MAVFSHASIQLAYMCRVHTYQLTRTSVIGQGCGCSVQGTSWSMLSTWAQASTASTDATIKKVVLMYSGLQK
jgi:hypothetical protein